MKRTKKFLVGFLACLSVLCGSLGFVGCGETGSLIEKGATENLHYQKIADKEEYRVIGLGLAVESDVVISATYNGLPVTEIWNYAFYNCDSLTSVTIPDSVTMIGNAAFYNCNNLPSITIPNSVTMIGDAAFYNCNSLTGIAIPDSVTTIGDSAFYNCNGLTSIAIPDSVTTIGDSAFYNCYKLVEVVNNSTHITVEKGLWSDSYIGAYALAVYNSTDEFTGTKLSNVNGYIVYTDTTEKFLVGYTGKETALTLPSYITEINSYAFYNSDRLTSVIIGNSVSTIGNYAFYNCSNLSSVKIGDFVTTIGNSAFYNCDSLTSVIIPNYVTTIGKWAFNDSDSLASVMIPYSVTTIGGGAFNDCDKLTSITFRGKKAEWNTIKKESYWVDGVPATKVVCSDGVVTL